MRIFYQLITLFTLTAAVHGTTVPSSFKAAPTRPVEGPNVIVEEQEVLETCDSEEICVQGQLHNNGSKTAPNIKLRIEIGGTRQGKPRHVVMRNVDTTTMNPGDRQEFYFTLDRKIPTKTKNAKGEEKIIEVGKYNFRIIPVWGTTTLKTKPKTKPTPKKK